jgi:hypothetical protein
LSNPILDGNPNALVFATPNLNPGGNFNNADVYNNHPIGVWYTGSQWAVFNEDATAIPSQSSYNIYAVSAPSSNAFVQKATTANSTGDWTTIDNPATNNNPNALLLVTSIWNPGGTGGIYDNHNIGVWYYNGKWAVFNEDATAIPTGAAFNVLVLNSSTGGQSFVATSTASNSAANYTVFSNRLTDSVPNAFVFVTPNWNISGTDVYDNSPLGVWYTGSQWSIYNQNSSTFPVNATFNVLTIRIRAV